MISYILHTSTIKSGIIFRIIFRWSIGRARRRGGIAFLLRLGDSDHNNDGIDRNNSRWYRNNEILRFPSVGGYPRFQRLNKRSTWWQQLYDTRSQRHTTYDQLILPQKQFLFFWFDSIFPFSCDVSKLLVVFFITLFSSNKSVPAIVTTWRNVINPITNSFEK